MNTLVVNFLAGPGAGKSTLAAGTFAKLKWEEIECEYVSEFAKDIVWGETTKILDDQIYMFAEQQHRIKRLLGKVEVIVTDAPLINSILYYNGPHARSFSTLIMDVIKSMNNVNFLLTRKKKYNPHGRMQTEEESKVLDGKVESLLKKYEMSYKKVDGLLETTDLIVNDIKEIIRPTIVL